MSATSVHSNLLKRCPLFENLNDAALNELGAIALARKLARREVLLQKGDPLKYLPVLLDGRLQGIDFTLDGREVGLYFVEPGEICGELSLIDRHPLAETIIAIAPSVLLLLPRERVRTLMFSSPEASERVALRLASRLRRLANQRLVLSLPNPMQRVCAQLLHLAQNAGELALEATGSKATGDPDAPAIERAPTHQEIAIMINSSRETVTRAFQQLQSSAILRRDGSKLIIFNLKRLEQMASGKE